MAPATSIEEVRSTKLQTIDVGDGGREQERVAGDRPVVPAFSFGEAKRAGYIDAAAVETNRLPRDSSRL